MSANGMLSRRAERAVRRAEHVPERHCSLVQQTFAQVASGRAAKRRRVKAMLADVALTEHRKLASVSQVERWKHPAARPCLLAHVISALGVESVAGFPKTQARR